MGVISQLSSDWLTPSGEATGTSKAANVETRKTVATREAQKASKKENEAQKKKDAYAKTTQVTIDLEEPDTKRTNFEVEITNEEEGGANPYVGLEELESPFRIRKMGPRKKQKSDKSTGTDPLVLMEGDLGEIGDVVRSAT